jgi:predicted enzyme related to lactoylglutathione lyase
MQLRLSHNVMKVRDLETMLDFYHRVLGFQVSDRGSIANGALEIAFTSQVSSDHHQVAFLPVRSDEEDSNTLDHMAFRVDTLADVREMIERVGKDGRASGIATITHGSPPSPTATPGPSTSATRRGTASRCSAIRRGTSNSRSSCPGTRP